MRLESPIRRKAQDPTIALINIVFLMLIFFLLAGTIAAGIDRDIELIRTSEAKATRPPAEPIAITREGELRYGAETIELPELVARLSETRAAPIAPSPDEASEAGGSAIPGDPVDIAADQALPARELIAILRTLKEGGFTARIVTRTGGRI